MSAAGTAAKQATIAAVEKVDDSVAGWLGDLITGKGDSPSHIIVNCILGCIPGVGQVIDLRDTVLSIIALTAKPTSASAWFELVLTLIAWIPGVGDVIKNVFKAARSQKAVARVLDMIPKSIAGDGIKFLQDLNFGKIGTEVSGYATKAIKGFVDALDSWVVKAIGGRARINGYIDALNGLLARKDKMIGGVMRELEELREKIIKSVTADSTAAVEGAVAGVVKQVDNVAEAAAKKAGTNTSKTAGNATPPASGNKGTDTGGGGKPPKQPPKKPPEPNGQPPKPDGQPPKKQPKKPPKPGSEKDLKTSKKKQETSSNSTKTNQQRESEFMRRVRSGALAEHITDHYIHNTDKGKVKINEFGKFKDDRIVLTQHGIDHIWRKKTVPVLGKPYVIGESKSTMHLGDLAEIFAIMAALPADVRKEMERIYALEDTPNAEVYPNEHESLRPDATKEELLRQEGTAEKKPKAGLSDTETKGTQMSHKWIALSIWKEERPKMQTKWANELEKLIVQFRQNRLKNPNVKAPYERWIVFVTHKHLKAHDTPAHPHMIQRPVFDMPDRVLPK